MIIKKFKEFCICHDKYYDRKNENIKKLEIFIKLKGFIYTILLFSGFIFITSVAMFFNVIDANLLTFKLLNVISLICVGMAVLEVTLHMDNVKELKGLIYTLFNKKKIKAKAKEEKKTEHLIEKEYMAKKIFILNEENLGAIYSEREALTETEMNIFYQLYQELPEEDLEARVKKRLSIYEKNTINNI